MLTFVDYFMIFFVIVILFFYIKGIYAEVEYKKSSQDGQQYLVRKMSNSQEAANYLADIASKLESLTTHYLAKYPDKPEAKRLFENFNKKNISESSPDSGYTSYSVNKGERIVLCIRQKDTNAFVDKNVIMYVAIHELAHLGTESIGHEPEFWTFFKDILNEAVEQGLYNKVDYSKENKDYCGIKITHSVI